MIRGIFIIHLLSICFAANTKVNISLTTGNRLAVIEFEGYSCIFILNPFLAEEFRKTVRNLEIFTVQDRGLTNEINIFHPRKKDYWSCWDEGCAINIGKKLKVDYIIAGNIQKSDNDNFLINGRLFSVEMETMMNEFALSSSGITDSFLLDMRKKSA